MWVFMVLISVLAWRHGSAECACPNVKFNQGDFYWREYYGVIPEDAVEGGFNESGNRTYVGQMASYKHVGLFPVHVISGTKGGFGNIVEKVYEDTYVRILCSPRHKEFEWKSTTADDMHLLSDYHLVIGGSQGTAITYIGRANYLGLVQIGRVHDSQNPDWKGLWINNAAGTQKNFKEFEVLVLPRMQQSHPKMSVF